jgi:hypothetical protein
MRPARPLLLGLVVVILSAWGARPQPPKASGEARSQPGVKAQGVASCAAAACHGGNGPRSSKGSEYSTWMAADPHSRAYSVLFDERSRRMAKQLWPEKHGQEPHPEKERLCLSCHVFPDPDLGGVPARSRFTVSDGVSCEACHGAAQNWLSTHYTEEWRSKTPAAKAAQGMIDTRNVRVRAAVCARCHVGEGQMDVNHDLIAAGHPRLRFEFAAYHANYPKHWSSAADRDRDPAFEARAWMVGQVVSARAALELLRYRAENRKPWPEFAEYNCAACHHDLTGQERQKRGYGPRRPGDLPWGSWYYPVLPTLAVGEVAGRVLDIGDLGWLMRARRPDQTKVAARAKGLAKELDAWAKVAQKAVLDRERLRALMKTLAGTTSRKDSEPATWDGATQVYLGLAALHQGLGDLGVPQPKVKRSLEGLGDELKRAFLRGRDSLYDTPSRFQASAVEERLRKLRLLLR